MQDAITAIAGASKNSSHPMLDQDTFNVVVTWLLQVTKD